MTPIAVTIAGSDSGGGAGIQADLKTFSALGVYGASVIAALTAQNTKGVTGIHDVPPEFVTAQIDAVFSDLDVSAVKLGMLSNAAVIAVVAEGLARHKQSNVVLDPVMVATSGDRLLKPDAVDNLRRLLDAEGAGRHAEPAGSRSAARSAGRRRRSRDARAGRAAARARRQGRADERRSRRRRETRSISWSNRMA